MCIKVCLYVCWSCERLVVCWLVRSLCMYEVGSFAFFHYMANRDEYKTETDSGNNTIALEQKQVLLCVCFFFVYL